MPTTKSGIHTPVTPPSKPITAPTKVYPASSKIHPTKKVIEGPARDAYQGNR